MDKQGANIQDTYQAPQNSLNVFIQTSNDTKNIDLFE